jgi:hypothetical protein
MGVVFDPGTPEQPEQGGPIFAASPTTRGFRLRFGTPGPDLSKVHVGDRVWISSDPRVTRAGEKAAEAGRGPLGRIAVDVLVRGREGEPLDVTARGFTIRSASALQPARGAGITRELLADKLGAFGGTPFHLGDLTLDLPAGLHLPVSELKEIRRQLVPALEAAIARVERTVESASVIDELRPAAAPREAEPLLVALCRNDEQLDAVLDAGCRDVELDWMELVGLAKAVERAKARGRIAVTVHHHIPTFHTEHCVYAHLLSEGRDFRSCGRPCEQHQVALRDRVGLVHPVIVDVGCRNTVFNAQAQSAAALVPELLARGVWRFRLELVRERADEATRLYAAYAQLVAGRAAPGEVVRAAAVHEQFGVTRGTMRTLTVLR